MDTDVDVAIVVGVIARWTIARLLDWHRVQAQYQNSLIWHGADGNECYVNGFCYVLDVCAVCYCVGQ